MAIGSVELFTLTETATPTNIDRITDEDGDRVEWLEHVMSREQFRGTPEKAQSAAAAYEAAMVDLAARYQIDVAHDVFDLYTRTIRRAVR